VDWSFNTSVALRSEQRTTIRIDHHVLVNNWLAVVGSSDHKSPKPEARPALNN
jgi:hypothetical protein